MKTFNFNICKYHITIMIEKKIYEDTDSRIVSERNESTPIAPVFVSKQYVSTVNEPPLPEIKMEEEAHDLCVLEAAYKYIDSKFGKLADSTRKGYKNIVENHLSSIWLYRLDRLTEEHLQEAFDAEIAKGLSVKTLKGYRTFIIKVLAEYRPDFHPNIRVTKEGVNETSKT